MTSSSTLLKGFQIPDVLPSSLPSGPSFSLVAGDFEEIYGVLPEGDEREPQQGKWDAVLTCFFIDTVSFMLLLRQGSCYLSRLIQAKNIVNYLKVIYELLKPGGVWINIGMMILMIHPFLPLLNAGDTIHIGPLLWHFENSSNPRDTSIELSLDEVKELARQIGFEINNEKSFDTTYVDVGDSMLSHVYHAAFWTATKKA